MDQDNTKLCDFTNTNNNDFLSTLIAPVTDNESCEIIAALLNLVMKDQFVGLPSEDAATHLNSFVDLCDMLSGGRCDICQRMAYHGGASRTSPVPGNGMRRRHARRRILPSFRALCGDNTPTAALRGLRMITR